MQSPPILYRGGLYKQYDVEEVMKCHFWDEVMKDCGSHFGVLSFLDHSFWGMLPTMS